MGRVETREEAFKLTFEYIMNQEKNEYLLEEILENKKIDKEYLTRFYDLVLNKTDILIEEINKASHEYSSARMFKVDLALIVMALIEIKYMEDIPPAVSINEALNLAKKYSTEKSASFINGILSSFVK